MVDTKGRILTLSNGQTKQIKRAQVDTQARTKTNYL